MNEIVTPAVYVDAESLYDFNQMHHELHPCSVGIGLGSHDPNVPTYAAELHHRHLFPVLVFTGGNAPTTVDRFPRGEAVHFREIAIEQGVPADAILIETKATHTGENVSRTRELLREHHVTVTSALVICRPYQQRRAYATFRTVWPDLEVICASRPLSLSDYMATIGDPAFVIDMMVGDTQRVIEYPRAGYTEEQEVPTGVQEAYQRLVRQGFTSRIIGRPA
jgi:uncharacterized SAM-binding protein YcdF (DUF218 family)